MKKVLFIFGVLLSLGMFSACSSDDVNSTFSESDVKTVKSYISGTIQLFNHEELEKYVFIDKLKMSKGNDKYSYIEIVVVPKDEFPLQSYQTGDVTSFKIVEVHSEFPLFRDAMHTYPPSTEYICSIELYK